jgi:putative DNA primase/helicase
MNVDAALDYARRGLPVIPLHTPRDGGGCSCLSGECGSVGKHPRTRHGVRDATTDEAKVRRWWSMWPDANIGIATGNGLVVLDVDPRNNGDATLHELEHQHGDLRTLTARTGGGGLHFYFAGDAPQGVVGEGLDRKGAGGYVVAPPSLHASGARYEWQDEQPTEPEPLPTWLAQLNGRPSANGAAAPVVDGPIAEGQRNATLASLAGTMRRRGMSGAAIRDGLRTENEERCNPPLPEDEVDRIAASVARYAPDPAGVPAPGSVTAPDVSFTDAGNAQRLVNLHGDRVRYIAPWRSWIVWDADAGVWTHDEADVRMHKLAEDVGRSLRAQAPAVQDEDLSKKVFAHGTRSLSAGAIASMVKLARGHPRVMLQDHNLLDADPWLLCVRNGVLDLRTGQLRPACPDDLITMQAPVEFDPAARAPRWERAMREWFPDEDTRNYVQRVDGSSLVGRQVDHMLVIDNGSGRNGKGVHSRTLGRVLGPFAVTPSLSLLVQTTFSEHATVKATLFRARLAVASETERGVKLKEASIKALTGGDPIRCRRMRENEWEFTPSHSLRICTNHLPEIGGRDTGIWSRIRVVPWVATFQGREDTNLEDTLAAEAPGILNWLIEGCLRWQREGLREPETVVRATLAYRNREDVLARFATDTRFGFDPSRMVLAELLTARINDWATAEGVKVDAKDLANWLRENGAEKKQRPGADGGRKWHWLHCGWDHGDSPSDGGGDDAPSF